MATVKILDRANELRFEILGKFAGDCVKDVAEQWTSCLPESYHRKLTVDISGLTGYDMDGRKVLRDMYLHGTDFACTTAQSLVFLNDISKPVRPTGVTMLRDASKETKPPSSERTANAGSWRSQAKAAGQH